MALQRVLVEMYEYQMGSSVCGPVCLLQLKDALDR